MFLKLYLSAFSVLLFIDLIWLGLMTKRFYAKQIGYLMRPDINWTPAVLFYLLFVAGLVLFVIWPALELRSPMHAPAYGALFGLVCYATYDLTNLATLKDWPLLVTIVDLAWGTVLSATVSAVTFLIARKSGW